MGNEQRRELIKVLIQMEPQKATARSQESLALAIQQSQESASARTAKKGETVFQMAKLTKWNTCRMNRPRQRFK